MLNVYSRQHGIADPPAAPWAVYLADADKRYRLIAFDLDAKGKGRAAAAARDAEVLRGLLNDVGLGAVVCESGPTGGRHVWTALADSIDAATVATLARLARHLCPTLDLAPLSNPSTGCVRPPGSPHRSGGCSTVIEGSLETLTSPTGTAAQVRDMVSHLAQIIDQDEPPRDLLPHRPLPLDEHGRLYLPGARRPLPAPSAKALDEDAACGDASAVLWRILIGAAAARWHHADIAALVETAPGLEHIRTWRDRTQRHPRDRAQAARVLARQWDKAVRHVASTPRQIGADPTFDARADAISAHVRDLQAHADAAAGRWAHRGGPADRRVLDVLCTLALQAMRVDVEADIRRLGMLAGVGRETARTALLRLADDGWITQVQAADGPHGAIWSIDPSGAFHKGTYQSRSQADPRPEGAGAAERTTLLHALTSRTSAASHDLFTPEGLGHQVGNIYARTTTQPQSTTQIAQITGHSPSHAAQMLSRLETAGVITRSPQGWSRSTADRRRAAAERLGVRGRLAARARLYAVERSLWAWWQAESAWMQAPRRPSTKHRTARGQLSLLPEPGTSAYGPHPRRADGRLDWRAARDVIENERNTRRQPTEVKQVA